MRVYLDKHGDRKNPPQFEAPGNIVFVTLDSGVIGGVHQRHAAAATAATVAAPAPAPTPTAPVAPTIEYVECRRQAALTQTFACGRRGAGDASATTRRTS